MDIKQQLQSARHYASQQDKRELFDKALADYLTGEDTGTYRLDGEIKLDVSTAIGHATNEVDKEKARERC